MKKLRLLTSAMLAMLVVALVIGAREFAYSKENQDDFVYSPHAFHIIYGVWHVEKDGVRTLIGVRVTDVDASGGGRIWGVAYKTDNAQAHSVDHPADPKVPPEAQYKSASFFRSSPDFLRGETVLGHRCFTLRMDQGEVTFCPEFGLTALRIVVGDTVTEALKVY